MPEAPPTRVRCLADPLDDSTRTRGPLTWSVLDRQAQAAWELCAQRLGVPHRRFAGFPAFTDTRPIVLVVDGAPLCNLGAWARMASLAPGARARPLHVAADLLVPVQDVQPPDGRRGFLADFFASRRRRRHQLRAERTLDAELARWEHQLQGHADVTRQAAATELPDYARAAVFAAALETPVPEAWAVAMLGFGAAQGRFVDNGSTPDDEARARLDRRLLQAESAESLDVLTLLAVARGADLPT
ncbi:MAG: hypothetical protein H7287_01825 [Thermoleophilia bacterium]|nr:hypothetical protein [Thermoleophilia bacterium]